MNAVARRNRTEMEKSRTLVLVATMRSPNIGSPDQTYLRARCAKLGRPRRATAPDFPACAASPKGTKELICDVDDLGDESSPRRRHWPPLSPASSPNAGRLNRSAVGCAAATGDAWRGTCVLKPSTTPS